MPFTPRCSIRSSTSSSRTHQVSSSSRRSGHWCATAPALPSAGRRNWMPTTGAGMPGSRSSSPRACASLAELGCTLLLEVGPQPVLTAAALRAWPDTERRPETIASLRRSGSDQRQISDALAQAYVAGHRPDFATVAPATGRKVDLPTYPFQHRKFWYSTSPTIGPADAARTETVRLLEEDRIDELAALVGAATGDDQTVDALKQLAAQHNQERSSQTHQPTPGTSSAGRNRPHGLGNRTDRGPGLASDRRRCGNRCATCRPADRARAPAPDSARCLDQTPMKSSSKLRCAPRWPSKPCCASCISAGLDPDGATSARSLDRMQHRVLSGTQRIFRAALAAEIDAPIWLVTRGAQRVTRADTVSPVQSSLWGFGRTASYEHPQALGWARGHGGGRSRRLVRVDRPHPRGTAGRRPDRAAGWRRLLRPAVAARRLSRPTAPLELRSDAAYLVTGGLGAVGLEIVEYLAAHGAGHLVLTGRRPPSEVRTAAHRGDARTVRLRGRGARGRRRRSG